MLKVVRTIQALLVLAAAAFAIGIVVESGQVTDTGDGFCGAYKQATDLDTFRCAELSGGAHDLAKLIFEWACVATLIGATAMQVVAHRVRNRDARQKEGMQDSQRVLS